MIRKLVLLLSFTIFTQGLTSAQLLLSTSNLFKRTDGDHGQLNIVQDPVLDSLINRYILMSRKAYSEKGGMDGYRIQIYSSSNRNAREESNKARAEFMSEFPEIVSYQLYSEPGYFKIRAGDFRSKTEATKLFLKISRVFPDAYIVPDIINFPELNRR